MATPDVLFPFFKTVHQKNKKLSVVMETVSLALMYAMGGSSFPAAETPRTQHFSKLLTAEHALKQRVQTWMTGRTSPRWPKK